MRNVILIILVILSFGCSDAKVSPDDFALNMVNGILKSDVADGESFEARINDPSINNVDTDKDGKIDYIMAKEGVDGAVHHITYVAHPSSGIGPDVPFATTSFEQGPEETEVHSAFLETVPNYEDHYYRDTMGSHLRFHVWLYSSRPLWIPFVPRSYTYHRRVSVTTFTTVQRSYQTRNNITVTPRRQRPEGFHHSTPATPTSKSKSNSKTASQGHSDSASHSQSKSKSPTRSASPSRHR